MITTEGGLWEQVIWGLEAIYANPFDPEAFGHAIYSVLHHRRLIGQLARFGAQKARACFTWTGIAQQILGLCQNLPARPLFPQEIEPENEDPWIEQASLSLT